MSDTPTPSRLYTIKYGKGGLLETAGRAYGLKAGAERLKRAQEINDHPLNQKFWRPPGNDFERKYFAKGIISFSPRFACDGIQAGPRAAAGRCFATIWIPPTEPYTHPFLGQGLAVTSFDEPVDPRQSEMEWDEESSSKGFSAGQRIDTTKVPFRWICRLRIFMRQPDGQLKQSFSSGTLIGPKHVLTAAHVFDADWEKDTPVEVLAINVAPGADGLHLPFSWSKAKPPGAWISHPMWRSSGFDPRFDVGLIRLPHPIGNRTFRKLDKKALGCWGCAPDDDGAYFYPIEFLPHFGISMRNGARVNICGYRQDGRNGIGRPTLLRPVIRSVGPAAGGRRISELMTYDADTSEGMSGAPVWHWDERAKRRHLIAVHHGCCGNCKQPPALDDCKQQKLGGKCNADPKLGLLLKETVVSDIHELKKDLP